MSHNDQIILDQIIEEQRLDRGGDISKSAYFELYATQQIIKDYDLSDEEVESGLVGSGNDGGIDSIYTFANGELVQEDFDYSSLKKGISIEIVITQAKTSTSFGEDTIHKLMAVTSNLFNLGNSTEEFRLTYNADVRSAVDNFRRLYTGVASKFPALVFRYYYVTRGDSYAVHPNVARKANELKTIVANLFASATFEFKFIGAPQLLDLARRQPVATHELEVKESLAAKDGYIALVRLDEYIKFIRLPEGQLNKSIFEANVRDYQGSNQVNEEMQRSLKDNATEDFWWLNNGITIVASKAVQGGKVLTIEDPQIVNGQQTSTEIYNYFSTSNTEGDARSVMVRVIVANESGSRDRIIKATNSQTSIPAASLRATDKIHRDIEIYLAPFSIYYDRRKNSQKQAGRPVEKIISIALLAQAVMAVVLQRPGDARARPSSLIKNGFDYDQLFNPAYPVRIYLVAATVTKMVKASLRTNELLADKDRSNLLFYVAMYVVVTAIGKVNPGPVAIAELRLEDITDDLLKESTRDVFTCYSRLGGDDQVAKGALLVDLLKDTLAKKFAGR